jgi:CRISPR-associated protein Cas2
MLLTHRRHFLVTYDIADDKRRDRVFDTLRDHGDHAQFSVFFCDLNPAERASLEGKLAGLIDHTKDQVLVVDLGKADHELSLTVDAIGRSYGPPARAMIV